MAKINIVIRLQKIINTFVDKDDLRYYISDQILRNLGSINSKTSINSLAEICNTSVGSISRYVKALGFYNYSDFQNTFEHQHSDSLELGYDLGVMDYKKNNLTDFTKAYSEDIYSSIKNLAETIDEEKLLEICDLIHKADTVIIYATQIPGNISETLQYNLIQAGKYVEFYPSTYDQIKSIQKLKENSLALVISLEGSLLTTRELSIGIAQSQAKTVLITQNANMKAASWFDQIIQIGGHDSIRAGKFKLLLFTEILSMLYYSRYKK